MSTHSLAALAIPQGVTLTKIEKYLAAHQHDPWAKIAAALSITIGTAERCWDRLSAKIDKANGKAQDSIGA